MCVDIISQFQKEDNRLTNGARSLALCDNLHTIHGQDQPFVHHPHNT